MTERTTDPLLNGKGSVTKIEYALQSSQSSVFPSFRLMMLDERGWEGAVFTSDVNNL